MLLSRLSEHRVEAVGQASPKLLIAIGHDLHDGFKARLQAQSQHLEVAVHAIGQIVDSCCDGIEARLHVLIQAQHAEHLPRRGVANLGDDLARAGLNAAVQNSHATLDGTGDM